MTIALVTANTKKIPIYSDLKKSFEISSLSNDITMFKDEDAVKESIKNLVLTDRGERLMQPNLGGNVRSMLFENMTPASLKLIEDQIKSTLALYEPRANVQDVIVNGSLDNNTVRVKVVFYIVNIEQPLEVDVFLERTR
jgi:phage baseplate assembly protein W